MAAPRPVATRRLITLQSAAEQLGVSEKSVRRYVALGKLPAYRVGGRRLLRIDEADLDRLIERVPTVGGAA